MALKILAPERINNPRSIARFQREARVGAQLQHENLVRIYDFGESEGRFFLVMEYIEGKTTATFIHERGPMPPATAVRLVRQVALGLEHVHRKGLIHRDVNPANILITHDGTAKLADLGLAIEVADEARVTREGATLGTFDYVAPEQARHSHAADIRSDIYSLGCTLYHMIAGQVPFPYPSLPEKLFGHQMLEPIPLNQLVPGVPEGLIEVVRRIMRKSPDERYATPVQVARALEPYLEKPPEVTGRLESARAFPQSEPYGAKVLTRVAASRVAASAPAAPQPRSAPVGLVVPSGATTARGSSREPDADDPAIPLLTPMDEDDEDEISLIMDSDPEPSPSEAVSPLKSRFASLFSRGSGSVPVRATGESGSDSATSASAGSAPTSWTTHSWFWSLIVLALMVTVLVVALALLGLPGSTPSRPAAPSPNASLG